MKIAGVGTVFKFNLIPLVLFFSLFTLLVSLGFWQLGRAEEKEVFLEIQKTSANKKIIKSISALKAETENLRFRGIELSGQYDNAHQFLIDNQIIKGQAGYFVMTPLKINGMDKAVLVNRGWVALTDDRRVLPEISIAELKTTVTGRINHFPVVGIRLTGAEIPTKGWPSVVQVVDINVLSEKLSYSLLPFQIELDANLSDGYLRKWKKNTVMPPEKHIAYAVQWFGLAITLTILFIWFSTKSK